MPAISLHTVPMDIQLNILGYVDPISLINLAQTCQTLRTIIHPTRVNLLQRLLALELLPEYGGIVPLIRGRDNQIIPPVGSSDWESNRYACGGCLKLLPHQRFDNHNILRLNLRKPPPGSREATRLAEWWFLNGWEDDVRGRIIQHRVYARVSEEVRSLADVRRQHYEATHPDDEMPHNGVNQFLWAADEQAEAIAANDRTAYDAELLLCGLRRHNRRCNECRFLRGDWGHLSPANNPGNALPPLPVATGRKLPFYNLFDRCFPTFFNPVPLSETGRRFTAFGNQRNKVYVWMMCTVRCRGCSKWQDASQFRLPIAAYKTEDMLVRELGQYSVWDAELGDLREPKCNRCFLRDHGMAAFRRHIVRFARSLLLDALNRVKYQVLFGWGKLLEDFRPGGDFASWAEYGAPIVSSFPIQEDDLLTVPYLTTWQIDDLYHRFARFKIFVKHMYQGLRPMRQSILDSRSNEEVMTNVMTSWFRIWYGDYYLYEGMYRRLKNLLEWIEQHEQDVVQYALGVDPLRLERYDWDAEAEEGEIIS
ncbi:hypothetical protein SMACR_07749 [Sordaria macrospora]|uniref:WGS project CABT00000000 data, contig 2.47 n=2 Tax=Sordaria macrospora TaxID=5147 RepID=F7W8X0_SORMK|nr:uncharacterized protein SMAC_07749 [Sordaria macrospora k-hell]KAA8630712.1 hypothetical protein SMACR_07749 [Sordaria macrospora]WPJ66419.1 hypothetical protein SMAC4_07749 [Sordaria macrospora]CCC05093.1 unnamed protein product [Sordaria macrospora k-hell]